MDGSSFSKEQKIQEALNQAKKRELAEKYGAHFSEFSKLPPEVEEQWLNNIEEFERQYQNSREITVRQFLGNPSFPLLEELPPEKVEEELASVLEYFAVHDVAVDCLAEVPNEELYRFVTTELMQAGINDVRIPGWTQHYIYEEFHPNDEYDATSSAKYFLSGLFARDEKVVMCNLPKEAVDDPTEVTQRLRLMDAIRLFHSRFTSFPHHDCECTGCRLDGEYAVVKLDIRWVGLRSNSLETVSFKGICEIRLRKSPYGLYDVLQASIPGFPEGRNVEGKTTSQL